MGPQEPKFLVLQGVPLHVTSLTLASVTSEPSVEDALSPVSSQSGGVSYQDADDAALDVCFAPDPAPQSVARAASDSVSAVSPGVTDTTAVCDYHIVYHRSFKVPALCLLARHQGELCQRSVHSSSLGALEEELRPYCLHGAGSSVM